MNGFRIPSLLALATVGTAISACSESSVENEPLPLVDGGSTGGSGGTAQGGSGGGTSGTAGATGGASGGYAKLTEEGRRVIAEYKEKRARVREILKGKL